MKLIKPAYLFVSATLLFTACNNHPETAVKLQDTTQQQIAKKRIQILDPEALSLIDSSTVIETIATGFKWTEGPLYISNGNYLLFSDIPNNRICKWKDGDSTVTFLTPSGNTGKLKIEREPGSNGLVVDANGNLVVCQHGDRRIARMNSAITSPQPVFTTLADSYQGKRLNSPNDAVYRNNGDLYFTDPPYGLDKIMNDTAKELAFQGVYRLKPNGQLDLVTKDLKFPNGIALSPDQKFLFVSNSDPDNMIWMKYELDAGGLIKSKQLFYEAAAYKGQKTIGNPDGMKISKNGFLFASGPEGLWIFNKSGKVIARLYTGHHTSNCCFSPDEKTLYLTCDNCIMRVKLK